MCLESLGTRGHLADWKGKTLLDRCFRLQIKAGTGDQSLWTSKVAVRPSWVRTNATWLGFLRAQAALEA